MCNSAYYLSTYTDLHKGNLHLKGKFKCRLHNVWHVYVICTNIFVNAK